MSSFGIKLYSAYPKLLNLNDDGILRSNSFYFLHSPKYCAISILTRDLLYFYTPRVINKQHVLNMDTETIFSEKILAS